MDFDTLHKQQLMERKSSALAQFPQGSVLTFYEECIEMLDFKKQALRQTFSLDLLSDFENSAKTFQDLVARRQQKLILKALNDLQSNSLAIDGLTKEEGELYEKLVSLLNSYKNKLNERIEQDSKLKFEALVFSTDFDELVASDSKTYGPFKEGQETSLPLADAEKLLKKGIAVKKS